MKFKISLLLLFLFLTAVESSAQPECGERFNPFYICRSDFERSDYLFYGEIVAVEKLKDTSVKLPGRLTGAVFKAVVKVGKSFKENLPSEITLYIGYNASCQDIPAKNKHLFQAVDGKLAAQKVYFTEVISRPLTDYSEKALKEVFDGIESALSNKTENFVEGLIYERLLQARNVTLKTEDADRLVRDFQNSRPLANIFLEAASEADGKIYQARSDRDGKFRIDNIPPGSYKIKLYLPADKEQVEPFTYGAGTSSCSRKWYFPVMPKASN